jgi:type II secretory pathway pseudopilin PulG
MNPCFPPSRRRPGHRVAAGGVQGMTLVETMVAMGISGIVLAVVAVLSVYALRSFTAMGNYAELEAQNRMALDRITRDLRQATGVVSTNNLGADRRLQLTNAWDGTTITLAWYAEDRVVECEINGQPARPYLTECDEWTFTLYQRTPMPGGSNQFYPVADLRLCRMIEMNWKCSRTLLGRKWNTESVQSARVVLRARP